MPEPELKAADGTYPDALSAAFDHLRIGDAAVRATAARYLGAVGDRAAAPALIEALLDEDPDVRVDAMKALSGVADAGRIEAILASLTADPSAEVKIAAIEALAVAGSADATPILLSLVRDRCEHDVVWDDGGGRWDDWLDVRSAAAKALGRLRAIEAIPVLLAARRGEHGQDLEFAVFEALAAIGPSGAEALIGIVEEDGETVLAPAAAALPKTHPETRAALAAALASNPSPRVRALAVAAAAPAEIASLARDDDPSERLAALRAHGAMRRDLVIASLADRDPNVFAAALELMTEGKLPPNHAEISEDLTAKLALWAAGSLPSFAPLAMTLLSRLAPDVSASIAHECARDRSASIDRRVAAVTTLAVVDGFKDRVGALRALALDGARQIRTSALDALAEIERKGGDDGPAAAETILSIASGVRPLIPYGTAQVRITWLRRLPRQTSTRRRPRRKTRSRSGRRRSAWPR